MLLPIVLIVLASRVEHVKGEVCDGINGMLGLVADPDDCSVYHICYKKHALRLECGPRNGDTVFDPVTNTCVQRGSKFDTCTKRKMLQRMRLKEGNSCYPGSRIAIANEFHCAQYFDCTDLNHTSPYPRVNECPFPNLFDRASEKCLQPELVKCDTRFEPKEPCEYTFNQCRESNCVPCRVRFGSCRDSPDGPNAWIGREFSPFFVVCKDSRVLYQDSCPHEKEPYMFHPTLRRCVPAWPLAGNMKMYMKP